MNRNVANDKTTLFFRIAMLEKLNLNNHKRHWSDASIEYLFRRLNDEVIELGDELNSDKMSVTAAMKECADVANMAMMIWDNLRTGHIDGSNDDRYLEPTNEIGLS